LSIRDILLFLDDGKSNADRMDAAIYLAKTHNAKLTAAALASLKPVHAKIETDDAIARMGERLAEQLVEDFTGAAELAGLIASTIIIYGDAHSSANKMAHYARNSDLVILHQPNPERDNFLRLQEFAQQVLLLSGRPVFFMPYTGCRKISFERIMIAWDGTPAASRAVHDSVPLLTRAKEVAILVVESRKQKNRKQDVQVSGLIDHLANHDIDAHTLLVNPGKNSVSTVILNKTVEHGIDLLVMGGHGTPTLKQKVFGGVTQSLLSSMIVPVVMSH
jgi:nucleotide-binding universal stress UspA family protein